MIVKMSRKKDKLPPGLKVGDLCSNTLFATVKHYFSSLPKMFEKVDDFRQVGKVTYGSDLMLSLGIIQRLIGSKSNNDFEKELITSSEIENNISTLLGQPCDELPSIDAYRYFFQNLPSSELHKVRRQMISTLERKKI